MLFWLMFTHKICYVCNIIVSTFTCCKLNKCIIKLIPITNILIIENLWSCYSNITYRKDEKLCARGKPESFGPLPGSIPKSWMQLINKCMCTKIMWGGNQSMYSELDSNLKNLYRFDYIIVAKLWAINLRGEVFKAF